MCFATGSECFKKNNNLLLVCNESEQEANIQQCSFSLSGLGLNCLTYSYV